MSVFHIIYASTSGHTEYVVEKLAAYLTGEGHACTSVRAEKAAPEDFAKGDVLILASGTWNTGGSEGQLNPHMALLFAKKAKEVSLSGRSCAVIGLGDDRYRYTARATEKLATFVKEKGGTAVVHPLVIINEPYGQESRVSKWGVLLLDHLKKTA